MLRSRRKSALMYAILLSALAGSQVAWRHQSELSWVFVPLEEATQHSADYVNQYVLVGSTAILLVGVVCLIVAHLCLKADNRHKEPAYSALARQPHN